MNTKQITGIVVGALIVAGVSFYGGMMYQKSHSGMTRGFGGNTMGGQFGAQNVQGGQARFTGRAGGIGGGTAGEVLSKDDKSITVKLPDGGSKIVFYTASTQITKNATATLADLTVGSQVSVVGTSNQDGSISAQSIRLGTGMMGGAQAR